MKSQQKNMPWDFKIKSERRLYGHRRSDRQRRKRNRRTDNGEGEREIERGRGGIQERRNKCLLLMGVGDIYRLTLKGPGLDSSVLHLSVLLNRPKVGGGA